MNRRVGLLARAHEQHMIDGMRPDLSLPRRPAISVLLFVAAGLTALFVLPFHVPVAPAISDSYTFGFNNRAALAIFGVFAIAFAY